MIGADMVQEYNILTGLDQVNRDNDIELNIGSTRDQPKK